MFLTVRPTLYGAESAYSAVHLQPAYRLATDIGADCQTITRVYQRLWEAIHHAIPV